MKQIVCESNRLQCNLPKPVDDNKALARQSNKQSPKNLWLPNWGFRLSHPPQEETEITAVSPTDLERRIQAFEHKCYRRMLGMAYKEHKTN